MIYCDHNATTPVDERVLEAMLPFFGTFYANPSSLYRLGRMARSAVDTAREQVAALVGARPEQIVFTSGGTEANNLALRGVMTSFPDARLAIAAIEHASVAETALSLQQQGRQVDTIGVNAQGLIEENELTALAAAGVNCVSIMLANNETGVIQDVAKLAAALRSKNIVVHSDAVQAAGKIDIDFARLGVQFLSLSSHKIYGPKGCGALVTDDSVTLLPQLTGGGQERGLRAGTENVAAIVGFGKAADIAKAELSGRAGMMQSLKARLEAGLKTIAGATIFSVNAPRLPNTVQFGIAGQDGEMLQMQLDRKGIAVSSGSACASGRKASHVLAAMGVDDALAKSAVRVSLGTANTEQDVDAFIRVLKAIL
ncbi:MAG: cysteine desulfurase family protein [Gammaproteobacteria bacterium]